MFGFKSSADAGKKEAPAPKIPKNPLAGCILLTATDCDTNTVVSSQAIKKSDLEKAAEQGTGLAVDGITILSAIPKEPKEPSKVVEKTKEIVHDVADVTTMAGKAIVIKTNSGVKSLGNFFSSIGDSIKEAAETYDQRKIEKAKETVAKAEQKDQA